MQQKTNDLIFALELARDCSGIFKKHFGKSHTDWKADNTPITQADYDINNLIIQRVATTYPSDAVYGEESSNTKNSTRLWVIDPIDGTQAFENGIPTCTIVIALIESDVVRLAVVYDPLSEDMYYAEKDKGAYKNDLPIHCNTNTSALKSYFAISSPMPTGYALIGAVHDRIEADKGKVFNLRSFTYCAMKVAEGKFCGSVLGVGRLFDIAAPALIVEEAGGRATDLSGKQLDYSQGSDGIIVTNQQLHKQFVDYMKP